MARAREMGKRPYLISDSKGLCVSVCAHVCETCACVYMCVCQKSGEKRESSFGGYGRDSIRRKERDENGK